MTWVAGFVLVWCAWSCWRLGTKLAELTAEFRELRYQQTRMKGQVEEQVEKFTVLRAHVAALADGLKVPRDQVLKGQFYTEIGAMEAYERTTATPAPPLIDVRSAQEFLTDHAVGAVLVPLDQLPTRLAELPPKDQPLLVICASGGRSLQAAEYLASQGWTDVASVRGGTASWPGPHEARTMVKLNYTPPAK